MLCHRVGRADKLNKPIADPARLLGNAFASPPFPPRHHPEARLPPLGLLLCRRYRYRDSPRQLSIAREPVQERIGRDQARRLQPRAS